MRSFAPLFALLSLGLPSFGVLGGAGCSHAASDVDAGADLSLADAFAEPGLDLAVDTDALPPQSTSCDPFLQDCTDPMNPKCSVALDDDGVPSGQCVPLYGHGAEGATCLRAGTGGQAEGRDDCAPGLFCTFVGAEATGASATRWCRRFCRADADCEGGELCARLDASHPADGACVPSCTPFASGCPATPTPMSCAAPTADVDTETYFATCRAVGVVPLGEACTAQTDCADGAFCLDPNAGGNHPVCTSICDDAHPCKTGNCVVLAKLPAHGGICK